MDQQGGIAGMREQILDNVQLAFPFYHKGVHFDEKTFKVIVKARHHQAGTVHSFDSYCAEVIYEPNKKIFLRCIPSDSVFKALEKLLLLSADVLGSLRDAGRLPDQLEKAGELGHGWVATG